MTRRLQNTQASEEERQYGNRRLRVSRNFRRPVFCRSHTERTLIILNLGIPEPRQDNPELLMKVKMRQLWIIVFLLCGAACLTGCGVVSSSNKESGSITITNAFTSISAGSAAVTLSAEVTKGQPTVSWSLTYATLPCAPACGTLVPKGDAGAVYTPPVNAPGYGQATITAVSTSDRNNIASFPFTIGPPISV